ncbi:MAG TPA: DUF2914 domain-containing protein [bacterium]|nr:DUF2914 domain-containing protein [bacterium]
MKISTLPVLLLGMVMFSSGATLFAQGSAEVSDSLTITSMVLTTDVVNREPADPVQTFSADQEEAFCHLRVQNSGEPTTVTFLWLRNGKEYFRFEARVGTSPNWRTFSSVTPRPGDWTVQILDAQGNVLQMKSFSIPG